MTSDLARSSDTETFAVLVTCHETSQNYLDFPGITNSDWDSLKAWLEAKDDLGTWLTDSLFSGPLYFYTVLSGFGPAIITATDHCHYQFNPR